MNRCRPTRTAFVTDRSQNQLVHSLPSASRSCRAIARSVAMLIIGVCAMATSWAHALTLCANSVSSLQTAFSLAQGAQQGVSIQIASGTYAIQGLTLTLPSQTKLLGGYDAACTSRSATPKASDTVIDFGGYGVYIWQTEGTPVSLFETDGLSLLNAKDLKIKAGIYSGEGNVQLSRTRVTGVASGTTGIEFLVFGGGSVHLDNVLIDTLPSGMPSGQCAMEATLYGGGSILMQNSTIVLPSNKNLCFYDPNADGSTASLYNSVAWSAIQNSAIDSHMSTINTFNSTFFGMTRNGGNGQDVAALHNDPQWVSPGSSDYRMMSTSTSVNSGTPIQPGGLSALDIDGQPRWQGQLPDRGAYESTFQTAQTYTVTNTASSGAGSLSDAMAQANVNPNLGIIHFSIPGACPHVIALNAALPKVTSPMLIDGTSQPGWVANTDTDAFLATLCVVVTPSSGTLPYAFQVPAGADASLGLRGIAMGGFQKPVVLAGGSGHVIAGNRFGGSFGNGIVLAGATLHSIDVLPSLNHGSFIIGGPAPADRNLISKSAFSGISVQSGVDGSQNQCQIVNNLIGTSPSGNVAAPNFVGITMAGDHCVIDGNRIVGNTTDGIVIDGSTDTVIQRNIIGLTVDDNGLQNSGAGIRFANFSIYAVVGAPLSTYAWEFKNTIRFMATAGIVIPSGTNNTFRSNEIRDNGIGGDGLDIDLGANGPTANDAGDVDTAANFGQNFPLVSNVAIPPGTPSNATNVSATITAKLDSLPGITYRMDAYFTNHCSGVNGRGHADAYLGGTTATNLEVFNFVVTLPNVLSTAYVSFTATDQAGNTSEMGACYPVSGGGDTIFKSSFEG